MKFSDKIGKCKAILFTNYMQERQEPAVLLNGRPLQTVNKTTLLGVVLDRHLTMKEHFEKLQKEGKRRMKQLCAVANTSFGPSQLSLRNMFVAYVRSVFDYASPIWYPTMSLTHRDALQRLQNKCLRVILGVPTSTRVQDLHLESNIQPLANRWEAATAFLAEKYRRHPPDDPLYALAHQTPPTRLRRRTWQHYSSETLSRLGIDPSLNSCLHRPQHEPFANSAASASQLPSSAEPIPNPPLHFVMSNRATFDTIPRQPQHFIMEDDRLFRPLPPPHPPPPLISMQARQPLRFTSKVKPWQLFSHRIKIVSDFPTIATKDNKRKHSQQTIEALGRFDLMLWTDGSVAETGHGGSACIVFDPMSVPNPYKRRRPEYRVTLCIPRPAGRMCFPSDAEFRGLESALDYILEKKADLNKRRIFIGTDCQSILKALDLGPHRRYSYLGVDTSPLWERMYWISDFCSELVLHYVPGHVGLIGNELADQWAQHAAASYTYEQQDSVGPSLSNLKAYLRNNLFAEWNTRQNESYAVPGLRQSLLQNQTAKLASRVASPRPFQTLFSRYRCDRAECAGRYPRHLGFIDDDSCRFCGDPRETIPHLLDDCSGTHAFRLEHGISTQTLVTDSTSSLLKIATFDGWLRSHTHFNSEPPENRIQQTLDHLEQQRKKRAKDENDDDNTERPTKRNCLVIPDESLGDTVRTKVRRLR